MSDAAVYRTARELLVQVAGAAHAEHTVLWKKRVGKSLKFVCSCTANFSVEATKENIRSLSNVDESKK